MSRAMSTLRKQIRCIRFNINALSPQRIRALMSVSRMNSFKGAKQVLLKVKPQAPELTSCLIRLKLSECSTIRLMLDPEYEVPGIDPSIAATFYFDDFITRSCRTRKLKRLRRRHVR